MEVAGCRTHSFAGKVDLHQWIHQVLPVAVKPENLPHPIHEGVVHCSQKKRRKKSVNLLSLKQR